MSRGETGEAKWEITENVMMIVGKYFDSKYDFINVMKVSKKYKRLVKRYYFNPISDCGLFKNMKSQ